MTFCRAHLIYCVNVVESYVRFYEALERFDVGNILVIWILKINQIILQSKLKVACGY